MCPSCGATPACPARGVAAIMTGRTEEAWEPEEPPTLSDKRLLKSYRDPDGPSVVAQLMGSQAVQQHPKDGAAYRPRRVPVVLPPVQHRLADFLATIQRQLCLPNTLVG